MRPLKRSKNGFEVELITLDNDGYVISVADEIMAECKRRNPEMFVVQECAKHMIELGAYPSHDYVDAAISFTEHMETAVEVAKDLDVKVFPLGTYPGKFSASMRRDEKYMLKEKAFGWKRWGIAGKCYGFHFHYCLPRGMFDRDRLFIKFLLKSKMKKSMMRSYNFLIASDPAVCAIMQSSPFFNGRRIGKDSRVIMYRGGQLLKNPAGLYSKHQYIGALPRYAHTSMDIMHKIRGDYGQWTSEVRRAGYLGELPYKSQLDVNWSPVKINKLGTYEHRGMDSNYPSLAVGTGFLISAVLDKIHTDFIGVRPSDKAVDSPFKFVEEDSLQTILLTPRTMVRRDLQYNGAMDGLEDDYVWKYAKSFVRLGARLMDKRYRPAIRHVNSILEERKTISDELLTDAKKLGADINKELTPSLAAELSLKCCERFERDLRTTKNTLESIFA